MLLAPVACFAELVETSLWALWEEYHALYTQFLLRPARKESKLKIS